MIADGQGVTVAHVAHGELSLAIGAPQVIGIGAVRKCCSGGLVAPPPDVLDLAVAAEHRVDGTAGGHLDPAGKPPDQQLPDLPCASARLAALEAGDLGLDFRRRLAGIYLRPFI